MHLHQPNKGPSLTVHDHELITARFDREIMAEIRRRSWRRRTNVRTTFFRPANRKPQVNS